MMMRRVLGLVACALLLTSVANAGPTITINHTMNYLDNGASETEAPHFLPPGVAPSAERYWRYDTANFWGDGDWGWTHDLSAVAPVGYESILSAVLEINAWDVDYADGERDWITADSASQDLEGVTGDWFKTTIALDPDDLLDNTLDVFLDIDAVPGGIMWAVTLGYSNVTVEYQMPDQQPPAAPVPGALLLSGMGAGLVSWLRRRRMV